MASKDEAFGTLPDGRAVHSFSLVGDGIEVDVLDWGGIVRSVRVPDDKGIDADVVLSLPTLNAYLSGAAYFGAIIGRCANRIDGGRFTIDGVEHRVPINDPPASLHGGAEGWDRKLWAVRHHDSSGLELGYVSPDGDEGFPGEVDATVRYDVEAPGTLRVRYSATTTAPTLVNLTNHSYFNLAGEGSSGVLNHVVTIAAERYLPLRDDLIPTGLPAAVERTEFDFRVPRTVGRPYDHNYLIDGDGLRLAARVESSGRSLEVHTTEPAIDFYTGNFLDGALVGPSGRRYEQFHGLAIEPGLPSNFINTDGWRDRILRPGQRYESTTEYRFAARSPPQLPPE